MLPLTKKLLMSSLLTNCVYRRASVLTPWVNLTVPVRLPPSAAAELRRLVVMTMTPLAASAP